MALKNLPYININEMKKVLDSLITSTMSYNDTIRYIERLQSIPDAHTRLILCAEMWVLNCP